MAFAFIIYKLCKDPLPPKSKILIFISFLKHDTHFVKYIAEIDVN